MSSIRVFFRVVLLVLIVYACSHEPDRTTTAPAASSSTGESLLHRMVTP